MGFFAWGFAMVFIFCFAILLLASFFVSVVLREEDEEDDEEDDEDDIATVELEMEVPPPCC